MTDEYINLPPEAQMQPGDQWEAVLLDDEGNVESMEWSTFDGGIKLTVAELRSFWEGLPGKPVRVRRSLTAQFEVVYQAPRQGVPSRPRDVSCVDTVSAVDLAGHVLGLVTRQLQLGNRVTIFAIRPADRPPVPRQPRDEQPEDAVFDRRDPDAENYRPQTGHDLRPLYM